MVREYVGAGLACLLAEAEDVAARQERQRGRAALESARVETMALETAWTDALDESAELFARGALLAAGFHRHDRGAWRQRREDAPAWTHVDESNG